MNASFIAMVCLDDVWLQRNFVTYSARHSGPIFLSKFKSVQDFEVEVQGRIEVSSGT
jgi:hypothetical protein